MPILGVLAVALGGQELHHLEERVVGEDLQSPQLVLQGQLIHY